MGNVDKSPLLLFHRRISSSCHMEFVHRLRTQGKRSRGTSMTMFMLDKSPIPCCFIVRGSRSFRCFCAFSAQKPREFFPFFYLLSHHEILPPCSASETSLTFSILRAVSVLRARIFTFLHTRPTNLPLISFFQ